MRVDDLAYALPPDLVAQEPPPRREDARLLVLRRSSAALEHARVPDLPAFLRAGDLLVANDTRVLPARLAARRATGGRAELLLLEPVEPGDPAGPWRALVRCGGAPRPGEVLAVGTPPAAVRLTAPRGGGQWVVEGLGDDLPTLARRHGVMPLPPYIRRGPDDPRDALDRERYQTVFARAEGAVAAPTAGLHLTPGLLAALAERGVGAAFLTLHVGLGTFEPVRHDRLEDHRMHAERYEIPPAAVAAVRAAREGGGRVLAVGTTSVRALEASAAGSDDRLPVAGPGRTDLLIAPGFSFRVVDALLTNFHLPRSTLLALVCAFAGRERVLDAYREAVAQRYRFHSYGDAMLIL